MIKLDKIREIKIFRCFTIVKAGLWCPRGDYGSCNLCISAWRHSKTVVSGELPHTEYSLLAELRRLISELGEFEMARIQKAELSERRGPCRESSPEICLGAPEKFCCSVRGHPTRLG